MANKTKAEEEKSIRATITIYHQQRDYIDKFAAENDLNFSQAVRRLLNQVMRTADPGGNEYRAKGGPE